MNLPPSHPPRSLLIHSICSLGRHELHLILCQRPSFCYIVSYKLDVDSDTPIFRYQLAVGRVTIRPHFKHCFGIESP